MFWTLLTAFVAAGVSSVAASTNQGPTACVSFDINWNLLAFGFNGKDYNVGTQDTWTSSGDPTDITTTGRPPFNSPNARCFLSQVSKTLTCTVGHTSPVFGSFTNAIYVLNADTANPTSIYIYDATAKSWSTQSVTANGFDPTDYDTILDHDTNVFYAYSNATIFSLDMQLMKVANASALPWNDVQSPDLSTDTSGTATPGANTAGYEPTLALAQNHVHFLGVPGLPAGDAKIFVIHFSFMQPAPQNYGTFPDSHGKAASFFLDSGVQQEFAYVPDDGSATYVINVETNTTKTLTGPPTQDALASYYASTSALVQLDTAGSVAFLAYNPNTTTSGGTWSTISKIPTATAASSSGPSGSTSTGAGSSHSGTSTSTGTAASGSSTAGSKTTSAGTKMGSQSVVGAALAVVFAGAALFAL